MIDDECFDATTRRILPFRRRTIPSVQPVDLIDAGRVYQDERGTVSLTQLQRSTQPLYLAVSHGCGLPPNVLNEDAGMF